MKKIIALSCVVLTMLSCRNNDTKGEHVATAVEDLSDQRVNLLEQTCYDYNDGKNRISLEFTEIGSAIKGNLTYAFAEKDQNSGSFVGQLKAGTLIADYTFQSEGVESVRQVAFKVSGDTLIEGYGDMTAAGTAFKDVNHLTFTSSMPLVKTECDEQKDACLFEEGKSYSTLAQRCITLADIKTILNPLKDGTRTAGKQAYVYFSADNAKVEVFLPKFNKGIVLEKKGEGNWVSEHYILMAWKGYVLQEKGKPIYGG